MFYLRDFKNFAYAELDFERPATLLIGPNGAGKSNLIEAVELLSFLSSGHPLHEITDLGREGGLEIRGGLDACARRGHEEFTLGFKGAVSSGEIIGEEADYELTIRVGKEPRIVSEVLRRGNQEHAIFKIEPTDINSPSADNTVRYNHYGQGKHKPTESIAADRTALSQYARFAKKNRRLVETLGFIDAVTATLAPPSVFDPIPKLMRDHQRASENQLARNGFNLSPTLNDLYLNRAVPLQKSGKTIFARVNRSQLGQRILERIKQLPDEPFVGFEFDRTKSGDVMFGFAVPGGGKPVFARVLSDGTLRALALLTALETSRAGRRLILEEFDNGVHPSRVPVLTDAIFECTSRNKLHVLATSHNPATLNALTPEQIGAVLLVVHDKAAGHARLIPVRELPGFLDFIEQGRLGDLITRRVYEQHLSADYEKSRNTEMDKWLASLP